MLLPCGTFALSLLWKMDICSLQNAKHSCWYPNMNNKSCYYSVFSLSARLYALCDIVLFNCHNSPWGRYRSLPCFTDSSSQSFCLLGTRGSEAGLYGIYFFFYLAEPQNSSNRSLSQAQRRMPRVI